MMFITNAYCQVCRWEDWSKQAKVDYHPFGGREAYFVDEMRAKQKTALATAFWPVYWTSRASLYLVKRLPEIEVKVKA